MRNVLLAAGALVVATAAQAGTQTISIYEDQPGNALGPGFSAPNGGVFVDSTQGFSALPASNGKSFGTNLLRLTGDGETYPGSGTGISGSTLNFALTGLQSHTSVSLDFLLAAIDSLDGNLQGYGPDQFTVKIDGTTIYTSNYNNCSPAPGAQDATTSNRIAGPSNLFNTGNANSCFFDSAYDMGMLTDFNTISHTSSNLLLTFVVGGLQDGGDESYGIDALSLTLNGTADEVPEPAMLGLFGIGAIALGLARRRR